MDLRLSRERFAAARSVTLATVSPSTKPHLVPVVCALDDDVIYTCVDHKPKRTTALRRLANIADNPAVSLLADTYSDNWDELWWVRVDGRAHVVDAAESVGSHGIDTLAEVPAVSTPTARWTGNRRGVSDVARLVGHLIGTSAGGGFGQFRHVPR